MPTALITGATGFIGQAACKQLLASGWVVKGTVRSSSQNVACLPDGVIPCSVNTLGPGTDWRVALSGIDVIVHLAARVHIMKETSEDFLSEFRQVNTHATERLARMAAQMNVRRLVLLSTVKVNGERTGYPLTPALSPEGRGSKLALTPSTSSGQAPTLSPFGVAQSKLQGRGSVSETDVPNPQDFYAASKRRSP